MDLQELTKWLETTEGKQWIDSQKKGLVDKNNELLEKLTGGNATNNQLNEKIIKLESDLLKANGTIREVLLSRPLADRLKSKGVFETLIPTLAETITQSYGLEIKANGNDLSVMGKVDGKETGLDQILDAWSKSDKAKECFKPADLKRESTSPDFKQGSPNTDKELQAIRRAAGLPEMKE